MHLRPPRCKHCDHPLPPRLAMIKRFWVCRGCGYQLAKPGWAVYGGLVLAAAMWIAIMSIFALWSDGLASALDLRSSLALFLQLDTAAGWGVFVGTFVGLGLLGYLYPFWVPYKATDAHPHCVACLYQIEQDTPSCPECGEVVPWNHALPPAWIESRFGVARCNCCGTDVPRTASFKKKDEWVCRGCGCILMQPLRLRDLRDLFFRSANIVTGMFLAAFTILFVRGAIIHSPTFLPGVPFHVWLWVPIIVLVVEFATVWFFAMAALLFAPQVLYR